MFVPTADLVDDHQAVLKSCEAQLRQYGGRARFSGPIETVKTYEDNGSVRELLSQPGEGRVLVVDGGGSLRSALVGDMLAEMGMRSGWAGIVVHGAVRDIVALGKLDIGIKALGSNPWRSTRNGGQVGVPVRFGGVDFVPGQWLYSDEDGIVVSAERLPDPKKG